MTDTAAQQAILRTINWFSLFDYPLTSYEVHTWLYAPERDFSVWEIRCALNEDPRLQDALLERDGYWMLAKQDPESLLKKRARRYLNAMEKRKRLGRALGWLKRAPGVEGIAIVNSLAWHHTSEGSDIDLLIIVKPGSLWTARAFSVLPFALAGARPDTNKTKKHPFCFSFFLTREGLDLRTTRLQNGDPYMAFWVRSLIPVFDKGGVFEAFFEKNDWARELLPNSQERSVDSESVRALPSTAMIDGWLERFQKNRLPKEVRAQMGEGSEVVVSDKMLKFHTNDRRTQFKTQFCQRLAAFDLTLPKLEKTI